jgi:hypothetical protein
MKMEISLEKVVGGAARLGGEFWIGRCAALTERHGWNLNCEIESLSRAQKCADRATFFKQLRPVGKGRQVQSQASHHTLWSRVDGAEKVKSKKYGFSILALEAWPVRNGPLKHIGSCLRTRFRPKHLNGQLPLTLASCPWRLDSSNPCEQIQLQTLEKFRSRVDDSIRRIEFVQSL